MKKQALNLLKKQTVAVIIVSIFLSFFLTAVMLLLQHLQLLKHHFEESIEIVADKKALEFNSCFSAVVKSVEEAKSYVLRTIDEEKILKDPEYEKKYMAEVSRELVMLAELSNVSASVYFRMNMDKYGGSRGVFFVKSPSGFLNIRPTNLLNYSPTDMNHVGWYHTPLWKGEAVWLPPYENKNINIHMVSYDMPLYKNGEFLGIIGMDINLATIKDIVDTLPIEASLAVLIGQDNDFVYYNNSHFKGKSVDYFTDIPSIVASFENAGEVGLQEFMWNSRPHFGEIRKLDNGMSLVIALSRDIFVEVWNKELVTLAVTFLLISLVAGLALAYSMNYIISPIKIITKTTLKLARGELNLEIPYNSKNELGIISDNIRMMTSQMKEYIAHISEQTKKERAAKEAALTQSKSKSEFLASMYLSLHDIDLENDSFSEIHSRGYIGETIGRAIGGATAVLPQVMTQLSDESSWPDLMKFVDLTTINERMKNKITIAQEFFGAGGKWCRGRFIAMDRGPDGTLKHVLWAVEYIDEERKERERLEGEVAKSIAASQAKSAFLANMSHEIRTPINAVLGMDEMILRESQDKSILEYAAKIRTAGTNLLSIVNEILDFSKIEAGKMELIPENYDISSITIDIVNMIAERAKNKGLDFNLVFEPSIPKTLFGDSVRIKQCILNLITNAVKYTREGGVTFTLGYEKVDENSILLLVSIKDTGIGIKEEDMEKLCSPFERIEEGRNKTIEGTGLGMSIVKRLLDMMDTRLEVQSVYGEGSEFSFKVMQTVIDWTETGDISNAYKNIVERMSSYKEKLHASRARLLFVDDTEMNLEVIKGLLKNTGIKLDTVLSGKQALEMVSENCYDIIFIDHRMPEMDGIETLHAMQNMQENKSAGKPCIALTANALTGVRKMYIDEGFTDYLSKPVDPDKLEDMIRRYLPEEYLEEAPESENAEDSENQGDSELIEKLREIEGIDVDSALKNCGSAEVFESTIKKYYNVIEEKASELEGFYDAEDWKNYCTKVHALKSTSRLVGLMEVSEKAAHLEELSDKKDADEIRKNHGPLMELYRSFIQRLASLLKEDDNSADKPVISEEDLNEKLAKIGEFADSFDIDGLDAIVEELSAFAMPPSFADKFAKIKTCIENVDFIELKKLL